MWVVFAGRIEAADTHTRYFKIYGKNCEMHAHFYGGFSDYEIIADDMYRAECVTISHEVAAALVPYTMHGTLKSLPQPLFEEISEHLYDESRCNLTINDFANMLERRPRRPPRHGLWLVAGLILFVIGAVIHFKKQN
jgi:hypothetical protein